MTLAGTMGGMRQLGRHIDGLSRVAEWFGQSGLMGLMGANEGSPCLGCMS
jgi:hypothetical protein